MATLKVTATISVKGFENYNYLIGQLFERIKENPEYLKGFRLTQNQFRQAFRCKEKFKNATIEAMKDSRKK